MNIIKALFEKALIYVKPISKKEVIQPAKRETKASVKKRTKAVQARLKKKGRF